MRGPTDQFREHVWTQAENMTTEEELSQLLHEIDIQLRTDVEAPGLPVPGEEPLSYVETQMSAAESWASLASYPMARLSAPASPLPRNIAGWGTKAVGRLRRIANTLSSALRPIAPALGAQSFSIGVSFPWGIQVSLSW
jgi:hypothetical protein